MFVVRNSFDLSIIESNEYSTSFNIEFFFLFLLNFFLSPRMKNNRVEFRFLCTLLQKKKKRSTMHASRFFVSTGGWKNDDRKIVVSTLR